MSSVHAAVTPINWPKDLQKYDIYINEERMYEIVFSSQQPKAKKKTSEDTAVMCYFLMFDSSNKLHAMEIENLTGRVQALEFTNEAHQQEILRLNEEHQQAIEEKDSAIALLNDDLRNCDNQVQAIQYENMALQAQRDVYKDQLQKYQDIITHLGHVMFLMQKIQAKTTLL